MVDKTGSNRESLRWRLPVALSHLLVMLPNLSLLCMRAEAKSYLGFESEKD